MSEQPKRSLSSSGEGVPKPAAPASKQGSSFMQAMQDSEFMQDKIEAPAEDKFAGLLDEDEPEQPASPADAAADKPAQESAKTEDKKAGKDKPGKKDKDKKKKDGKTEPKAFEPVEYEDTTVLNARVRVSRRRREKQLAVIIPVLFVCVVLNAIAWKSSGFARGYMEDFFPNISKPYAMLMEKIPFSFGELLIQIGLWIVAVSTPVFILLMIVKRKSPDFKRTLKRIYGYFYAWVLTFVMLTETLNCFVLYHTPTFAKMYGYPGQWYTPSQLEQLCDHLIAETNAAAKEVKRDKDGRFVLTADLDKTATASMRKLSKEYPELGGWYTTAKPIKHSFFMSQQYTMGIYFPFTMEANYNTEMPELNLPDTICHELAHTKGFMREDEANFIAFLACDASDSADYRYSGYIRAMKYVLAQCEENCSQETVQRLHDSISDEVYADWNANREHWQEVQESDEGLFDSEKVAEVSDKVADTSMKLNGVEDGKKSYDRVTDLLLDWYFMQQEEETENIETHKKEEIDVTEG